MLLTVAAGITVRDKQHCRLCGNGFRRGDRLRPLWVVAGTTPHPKTKRVTLVLHSRTDMPAPQNEYAHVFCDDPQHRGGALIQPVEKHLPMDDNLPDLEPRGDDAHCIHCKKLFARGDRITLVYLCQGTGRDPETGAHAAKVSGSYEPKHERCDDPRLEFGEAGPSLILTE